MRLKGTLYADESGDRPIFAYARDADNENRMVKVELRVIGNRVVLVPDAMPGEEPITATPDGKQPVPEQRRVPLRGDDFS